MKNWQCWILGWGLAMGSWLTVSPALASGDQLRVSYPPVNHSTTSDRIFFIGTAPVTGEVLVNGKPISRSPAGHFAPSFPLKMGQNTFQVRYQNQEITLKVTRNSGRPTPPSGFDFAPNSLTPAVDVSRMPGELLCFGAVAPPDAEVSVKLGDRVIPLFAQSEVVDLPPNSSALTGNNQPIPLSGASQYLGCAALQAAADLGRPEFHLSQKAPNSSNPQPNPRTVTKPGPGKVEVLSPANLEIAVVKVNAGVARTGPSTDYSRLTPLPKGTRATITAQEGEWVRLDYGGWINAQEVEISKGGVPPRSLIRSVKARQIPGATEVIFPLQVPVPVTIQQNDRTLTLNLYNTTAQTDTIRFDPDPVVDRLDWQQIQPTQVQYTFNLKPRQQWGYKLRYEGTNLILTIQHPPRRSQQPGKPLAGLKILLDPGHGGTESGAVGPTGYAEKDLNLYVSKLIGRELIARGATVYLTREDDRALSLPERVALIEQIQPAVSLSIHYNSLPDDGDPINTQGFGVFWYHPQAYSLARVLHNVAVTQGQRPSYGVFWNNLALARPANTPSVLVEIGFMSNPTEYEWITNPQAQQQMSVAIADGITQWFNAALP